MSLENNRLVRTFAALRAAGKKALMPFITAGYPSMAATEAILARFDELGVPVCELGVPFSDPIADGPVIQASYTEALAAGVTVEAMLAAVRRLRDKGGRLALVAMVSYSIVFRLGPERFAQEAAAAGLDGLIIPDLPLGESEPMERIAAEAGLAFVLLIAPTTPPERQIEIARHSRGFIYFISVAGITGERRSLPPETIAAVVELRRHTDTPVCVGFGVSSATTVAEVTRVADGAIVGSAIVHRLTDYKDDPLDKLVQEVGRFVELLMTPLR